MTASDNERILGRMGFLSRIVPSQKALAETVSRRQAQVMASARDRLVAQGGDEMARCSVTATRARASSLPSISRIASMV
jgi:hypothetical protein